MHVKHPGRLLHCMRAGQYRAQRLKLNYVEWGEPSAPPVILLHGGKDHARSWDEVAQAMAHDHHVIVPDLRGHGDSDWADAGGYTMPGFIYDLTELIRQKELKAVNLIGHSLGGNIVLRTAGLYPEWVRRVISIEGLGPSPQLAQEMAARPVDARLRGWIEEQRQLDARSPRRYASIEDALERMQAQNPHLSAPQALHLTQHGVRQTEDGGYVWKFDPYLRSWPPIDLSRDDIRMLWGRIHCPVLLVYGSVSWASNPGVDGRASAFRNARVETVEGAGHWVHHDRLETFLALSRAHLS
jgi:pimeloyl-ACP methyl ester carboxylesterase